MKDQTNPKIGNPMNAMNENEMTEDELESFDLEETSKKIQAFMERFNFGVNKCHCYDD